MKKSQLLVEVAKIAAFGFSSLTLAGAAFVKSKAVIAAAKTITK